MAVEIDAIAVSRMNKLALIDGECRHPDSVAIEYHAVACKFMRREFGARRRDLFVYGADLDVIKVVLAHSVGDPLDSGRSPKVQRLRTADIGASDVAERPEVGQAVKMVGMEVGDEDRVDLSRQDAELIEPNGRAASGELAPSVAGPSTRCTFLPHF